MKNKYQIIDTSLELGIPGSEIYGDEFHYLDLYEQVGSKQLMTTFFLKEDSESYKKYGKTIIGTIHYKPEVLKKLKEIEEFANHPEATLPDSNFTPQAPE